MVGPGRVDAAVPDARAQRLVKASRRQAAGAAQGAPDPGQVSKILVSGGLCTGHTKKRRHDVTLRKLTEQKRPRSAPGTARTVKFRYSPYQPLIDPHGETLAGRARVRSQAQTEHPRCATRVPWHANAPGCNGWCGTKMPLLKSRNVMTTVFLIAYTK